MYDTDMDTDGIMEYTIVQHCTQDNKIIMMTQDPECISLKQRPASLLFFLPKKQKIELKKLRSCCTESNFCLCRTQSKISITL